MRRLPFSVRISLVVTLFMIAVSVFATERVLNRLQQTQSRQIEALAALHLDGIALAIAEAMVREDTWQVFDVLDRAHRSPSGVQPRETVVTRADGTVIASSTPLAAPAQQPLPRDYADAFSGSELLVVPSSASTVAFARRDVQYEGRPIGAIFSKLDLAPLIAERSEVLRTLVATNAILTLLFAGLAAITVRRMMRPLQILTAHLERHEAGQAQPVPDGQVRRFRPEFQRAFAAYNGLVSAVRERETMAARLAEEERLASLGRLASGMAHEINNPLGGLFNAIDTLKRHGQHATVRDRTIDLIDRGLKGIRDVVRAALMTYRAEREVRPLRSDDIEDMRLLLIPEVRRRAVQLDWHSAVTGEVLVDAGTVRQVLLNLSLNACQAVARDGRVSVRVGLRTGALQIQVRDNGSGLPEQAIATLTGEMSTPAPIGDGHGLGLWMTSRLVRDAGGEITWACDPAVGTALTVRLPIATKKDLRHVA